MKRNAIITFDYEVFLGRNTGTVENSVLRPANAILEILKANSAKAIFFVDTTWLLFIKEHFPEDFNKVSGQLKEIVACGSSVELHLHPQWIDAYVENGAIVFNTLKHYSLQSLNKEQTETLFRNSVELLQGITGKQISCFRAGGWCIEPFKTLNPVFRQYGIKYEFSVVPGIFLTEGKEYDYDFRHAPRAAFYRFSDDTCKAVADGDFTEFPVSTYRNSPLYRVVNKTLLKLKKDKRFGDGVSAKESPLDKTLLKALKFTRGMLTLDKMSSFMFRYLLRTHFRKTELIVAVSHPKIVSGQALLNLKFITEKFNTFNSDDLDRLLPGA